MATRDRREREKAELRAKILDTARGMFAAQGYEAVSMRRIADAIEYSPTAIYAYFQDKEALFRELCALDFAALARLFQKGGAGGDPVDRIRRTGLAYVEFAVKHPNHYRLMFMTAGNGPGAGGGRMKTRGNPDEDAYAFLRSLVEEALAAGRFRPGLGDAELLTQTLWAGVHGVASLQIVKGADPWVDWRPLKARAREMVDVLLRGMVRQP